MTDATGRAVVNPLNRSIGTVTSHALGLAVGLGLLGAAEVAAAFVALMPNLPATIPDHFDLGGNVNGAVPRTGFLAGELVLIGGLTAVFALLIALTGRSAPLSHQFGSSFLRPLLAFEASVVTLSVPAIAVITLVRAAGVWNPGPETVGLALFASGLIPLGAVLLVVVPAYGPGRWAEGHGAERVQTPSTLPRARASVRFGLGAPVEMQCSACGEPFELAAIPLLAPHMGLGGEGSLYITCPRCGERGWDPILRRLPA
jgi:hypothetical protein